MGIGKNYDVNTTIVVGIDPSQGSQRAVQWAAQFARQLDLEVHAIHVMSSAGAWELDAFQMDSDQVRREREQVAHDSWTAPLREAGVSHRVTVVVGDPAECLVDAARREKAAIVVVGASSRGPIGEALLGSVTKTLIDKSDRPVAVVPAA